MHPLLWMNVMLDFICMGFTELWGTGSKPKCQNENICLHRESNQRPLAYQSGAFDRSAPPTGCVLNSNTILAFNKTNTHDVQSMYQIDYGLVCSCKVMRVGFMKCHSIDGIYDVTFAVITHAPTKRHVQNKCFTFVLRGVGEGWQVGTCPNFQKGGDTSGFVAPTIWTEQMF